MPAVPAIDTVVRRCATAVAAGILLPPALAGCGGDEDTGEDKSGSARDVPVVAREQLKDGGTVRWAVDTMPPTLNTFQTDADATTDRIAEAVLPALFTLDSRARPQPNADYLESAEITEREPRLTVVYTLNPKARWSDGRPIGLADFQAQWKALDGSDNAYWTARNVGYDRIRKVAKGGERNQVKVTFARPYSDWKSLFTPLYPKAVMGSPTAFNDATRTKFALSGGPFRIKDGEPDREKGTVTLERNPKWWGQRAKLDKLVLTAVERNKRGRALADGKLDLAEIEQPVVDKVLAANVPERRTTQPPVPLLGSGPAAAFESMSAKDGIKGADGEKGGPGEGRLQHAEALARTGRGTGKRYPAPEKAAAAGRLGDFVVRRAYAPAYTQLALNGASEPLRDQRVRRAIAQALNRRKLAESVLDPTGLPVKPLGSHLRMLDQDGYHDNSGAVGEASGESASSLLAEAGWKGGPSVRAGRTGSDEDAKKGAEASEDSEKSQDSGDSPYVASAPVFAGLTHSSAVGHAAVLRQAAHAGARVAVAAEENGNQNAAATREAADASMRRAKEAERALARFVGGLLRAEGGLVRTKDGEELVLRMVLPAGDRSGQIRRTGRRIAYMLERVGVRTKIVEVADEAFFKDHIAAGDFDMTLYSWPAGAYPVTDARPIFAKPEPAPDGSLLVEQNYSRVGTDQIDSLFEQAAGELDEKAKADLIQRIDARIWAVAGSIPLYQRPQLVAVQKKLGNVGAFGFETPRYQDIGYAR